MDIINELGLRVDGRQAGEIRNTTISFNSYTHADGSSYVEQGNTKVCSVCCLRSREARYRSRILEHESFVNAQFSQALFSGGQQRRRQRGDRAGHKIQLLLEAALKTVIKSSRYPRCQIDVYFEVLEADGSVVATCFNAGAAALADAGIEMIGLPAAISIGVSEGTPCVDLCGREETASTPVATIGIVRKDDIILLHMENTMNSKHIDSVLSAAEVACAKMSGIMEAALMKHLKIGYERTKLRPMKPLLPPQKLTYP